MAPVPAAQRRAVGRLSVNSTATILGVTLVLLVSANTADSEQCPSTISTWRAPAPLTVLSGNGYRGVVLPPEAAKAILCPCSRSTPGLGDSYFQPSSSQIVEVESKLAEFLRTHPHDEAPLQWRQLSSFMRQYLGVMRAGGAFIYVNLFRPSERSDWRDHAVVVCDGGPAYFGVEYDLGAGRFHHIDFNGSS
jgi:hypothetical protein